MIVIARHMGWISSRPLEYVRSKDGKLKTFESEFDARFYLLQRGMREEFVNQCLFLELKDVDK